MDEPLVGSCPGLGQFNDKIAGDYLARLDKEDVAARVRAKIIELLSSDDCGRRVAREMAMSEATLHLKLAQRETSFNDLLNESHKELAQGYLAQRALSVPEIAFLLGFTDTSNLAGVQEVNRDIADPVPEQGARASALIGQGQCQPADNF